MNIKALFEQGEDGKLSYDEFEAHVKEAGLKLADLSDGKYVSKSKYDKDIEDYTRQVETLNAQVETLNGTITTRDEDLANLQDQLKQAGEDKTKLAQLSEDMSTLQAPHCAGWLRSQQADRMSHNPLGEGHCNLPFSCIWLLRHLWNSF